MDQLCPRAGRRLCGLLAAGLLSAALASPLLAAASEDEVKAAYLFNFARYVTWPPDAFDSPESEIRICVVGDEAFRAVLEAAVAGKKVGARAVAAVGRDDARQAADCHIAFLGSAGASAAAALAGRAVFTVSDDEGFAAAGGVANFFRAGSKMRFEINTGAAEEAGLQVSSRLLRLARIVE